MKYAIIHIADIHYRKEEPEGASAVLSALIADLKKQKDLFTEYKSYLAITGDIIFAGKDVDAYASFKDKFDSSLGAIGLPKVQRILVPGNHDVDRLIIEENDVQKQLGFIRDKIADETTFNNYLFSSDYEERKFDNYQLFESDFSAYGLHYEHLGKGWDLSSHVGVYCLNTALCSFGGINKIDDTGNLAICTRNLVEWCNNSASIMKILLMHHPFDSLVKWSKNELKHIIEKHFALCICGHNHEQGIYYNRISNKSLICSAPQLFTKKTDDLGYAIIFLNDNSVEEIKYRQYINGQFLAGVKFAENDEGIVNINNHYRKCVDQLKKSLDTALAFFKGQPKVFIEPKLSKEREFNKDENLLNEVILNPTPTIIVAHPQFGLTCLAHHMRLEAFKANNFWIYIDAKYSKARKIDDEIEAQLHSFDKRIEDVKCIIVDSWDGSVIDHGNIIKRLDSEYDQIPVIIMSNYSQMYFNLDFDFRKLKREFNILHLQALQREKVRELVSKYNSIRSEDEENIIVTKVVKDLEALNIHRTPLNCLTLLKVFERDFNEDLVNRTKMIKALLFILFTDSASFTYASTKPDVDDCEYILGKFCKKLIEDHVTRFSKLSMIQDLEACCKEKFITVDISVMLDILETNNILLGFGDDLEFKHRYWIFYFASIHMRHDKDFHNFILENNNYVNFTEIIEFYTGYDGNRDDAIKVLVKDLDKLTNTVNDKIGIPEDFNPFNSMIWNPSEDDIKTIKEEINERVTKSNLPVCLRDKHADRCYNSEAPYNQSINEFLNEFAVISLMQSIKAASRALRNSKFVDSDIKKEMMQRILLSWEQISRVIFWISPTLAREGRAAYEGWGLLLVNGDTCKTYDERLKAIFIANPRNVVNYLKDDLSSKKIGPLLFEFLKSGKSKLQRHLLAVFLIRERPEGWHKAMHHYMNLLHPNSFYLGDLCDVIESEIELGFASGSELRGLKELTAIVVAKLDYFRKSKVKEIPAEKIINELNELEIDKIRAKEKQSQKPFKK